MWRVFSLICTFSFASLAATEGAFPLYMNGYMSSKAAWMPDPGLYFRNDVYHHPGHVKGSVFGGVALAKANAKISLDVLNVTYVTPLKLLGANVGCCLIVPFGRVNVHAEVTTTVPQLTVTKDNFGLPVPSIDDRTITRKQHQVAHGIADTLIVPLMLGWHVDNLHFLAYHGVFVPTGKYTKGKIANMGQNHFALETDAGFTWLNPNWGTEISAITGVTVNFTNHKIHYRSGTGWHTEFFLGQYLTPKIQVGLAGYWFYQLTPDKGSQADALNGFRGRVLGLGPCLSTQFSIYKIPIFANIRYYKEMHSKNYLKGDTFYLTITIPL